MAERIVHSDAVTGSSSVASTIPQAKRLGVFILHTFDV